MKKKPLTTKTSKKMPQTKVVFVWRYSRVYILALKNTGKQHHEKCCVYLAFTLQSIASNDYSCSKFSAVRSIQPARVLTCEHFYFWYWKPEVLPQCQQWPRWISRLHWMAVLSLSMREVLVAPLVLTPPPAHLSGSVHKFTLGPLLSYDKTKISPCIYHTLSAYAHGSVRWLP